MDRNLKWVAIAALLGSGVGAAQADMAETKGGITIKTEDGRFEAKIGGRIHLDTNIFDDNEAEADSIGDLPSSVFFRRARLILEGKAYGWSYKFENDFAGQDEDAGSGFREMWIGTRLGPANLRLGNAKPYRSMEELTSSNEIQFMERPFSSATGIYRQYQLGAFLDGAGTNWGWGLSLFNLKSAEDVSTGGSAAPACTMLPCPRETAGVESSNDTDGMGYNGRLYFAPVMTDAAALHLGASASLDKPENRKSVGASVRPFGRKGPSVGAGSTLEEQTSFGFELAGKSGPLHGQAEYAIVSFDQDGGEDQDVDTYYLQASFLITGESKPYDVRKGVFKSPKPKGKIGAWELKARYDVIELDTGAANSSRDVSHYIVGLNWFVNPNVRFMLEYIDGKNEPDSGQDVSGSLIATRAQFSF